MFQIGDWRVLMAYLGLLSDLLCKAHIVSPEIYLTGAAGAEMVSRLPQKCFGVTRRCLPPPQNGDVPPKNVWLPPKDRLGPPENVLGPPSIRGLKQFGRQR